MTKFWNPLGLCCSGERQREQDLRQTEPEREKLMPETIPNSHVAAVTQDFGALIVEKEQVSKVSVEEAIVHEERDTDDHELNEMRFQENIQINHKVLERIRWKQS